MRKGTTTGNGTIMLTSIVILFVSCMCIYDGYVNVNVNAKCAMPLSSWVFNDVVKKYPKLKNQFVELENFIF